MDWATISFSVEETRQNRSSDSSLGSDIKTVLIVAVPANITTVGTTSYLVDLFDRALQNQTDHTVSLSIPLNTALRLAKVVFKDELTVDMISTSRPTGYCTGVSEPFTVSGGEARKTVAIATDSSRCEKSITAFKFEAA